MKKTLLTLSVFLATVCPMLAPAANSKSCETNVVSDTPSTMTPVEDNPYYGKSIGTVEAKNVDYGPGDYVCQISEKTTMYFCIDGNDGRAARLTAIYTSENSAIIPDSVQFIRNESSYGIYPVTIISDYFGRSGYNTYHYPYPSQLTTLTLPPTVKYYQSYHSSQPVDKNIETVYLLGDACEYSNADTICAKYTYVCDKSFLSKILSNKLYSNSEILPYGWEYASATVNVNNNGEFAETYLTQNNYDWGAIQNLKVTGNINSLDLNAIKRLTTLMKLDISETSISEIPDNYMYGLNSLTEALLPPTIKKIGKSAFSGCKRLRTTSLSGIKEIGADAFSGCSLLKDTKLKGVELIYQNAFKNCSQLDPIDLSGTKYIGFSAFSGCSSLTEVSLDSAIVIGGMTLHPTSGEDDGFAFENCVSLRSVDLGKRLQRIGSSSFRNTALKSIIIPEGIEDIPTYAFCYCSNLESVTLPSKLKIIESNAFSRCAKLTDINIEPGVTEIGDGAFMFCNSLKKVSLPPTIKSIGQGAFWGTGLQELVCQAAIPPIVSSSSGFVGGSNMDLNRAILYVPSFSRTMYRNNEDWSVFNIMKPIEADIDYLLVNRPLSINLDEDNNISAVNPTIDLRYDGSYRDYDYKTRYYYTGQLTTTGEGTLSAGKFIISSQLSRRTQSSYQYIPTLINYTDNMRADSVTHKFTFYNYSGSGEWHFVSLPYDVKVSDIIPSDNTYWVIRRYDSAARAAGKTSSTWVNLTNKDILEAGKGYIISAYSTEYDEDGYYRINPTLSFTSGNSITKNQLFRPTDIIVPLTEYPAEFAHNRSWNLIGNPYPCYFDTHYFNEEFASPLTVWNGSSYVAYSPIDDHLVLSPYEAFFVQCPLNTTEMIFKTGGRLHSDEGKTLYRAPVMPLTDIAIDDRNVFNFEIRNNQSSDRARIVLNADASIDYEIGRDASKFFATDCEGAQLYIAGDVNYSISERPVNDGCATLGVRASKEETYTLSLSGKYSSEWHVIVTDNATGISVDLTKSEYPFTAIAGDSTDRFSVSFRIGNQLGIESVIADFGNDTNVTVTALNGVTVYTGRASEINVPSPGMYVISNGQKTCKAILK